jgi:hypothetical protein
MGRTAIKAVSAPTPALPRPDHRIDVAEIIGVAFAADHLHMDIGAWEIVPEPGATAPTLECRTADGRGVAVAFGYDPITAIPQLQVAVDV